MVDRSNISSCDYFRPSEISNSFIETSTLYESNEFLEIFYLLFLENTIRLHLQLFIRSTMFFNQIDVGIFIGINCLN